tara:strand:+ start:422 stop:1792 length:1371 start_codon:yes stop_codon:yes gene_type:complete
MENETAIKAAQNIASTISGFGIEDTSVKKETGKSITLTQTLPDNKRVQYVQAANKLLVSKDDYEFVEVTSNRATKDFKFKVKNFDKDIIVQTKPNGKRGKTDPNELLTAGLACMRLPRVIPNDIVELDALVDEVKKNIPKTVKDYDSKEFDAIDGDYSNFCQAFSAAVGFQKYCGGVGTTAYVTGRVWNKSIEKFKRNAYGMKDFNSSDIVIKKGAQFYGVSLKKKDRSTSADPTLLNKSVSNLFTSQEIVNRYNSTLQDFMINKVIKNAEAQALVPSGSQKKANADRNTSRPTWKKLVSGLPNKFFNDQLKGKDSIFGRIGDMFEKEQDTIAAKIMQLVLKTDLRELNNFNFKFVLITGVGRYLKSGPVVEKADIIPVDTVSIKVSELLKIEKPKIKVDKESFIGGAAVLAMQLTIGKMEAIDIAMRYKGSGTWTSQPSVTAFLTRKFKEHLKDI